MGGARLIYGLVDPRTLLVRYVGQSARGLARPRDHRGPARDNTRRSTWIKSLRALGLNFEIVVLEQGCVDLDASERWWIAYGRASGWALTNHTDGGDGCKGRTSTDETRARLSEALRGRVFSPEWRAKISAAKMGHATSPEHRAKLAEAGRKRVQSPETRARIATANRRPKTDAEREAMSIAARKRVARDGYAVRGQGGV